VDNGFCFNHCTRVLAVKDRHPSYKSHSPRIDVLSSTPLLVEFRAPRIWIFLSSLQEGFFSTLLDDELSRDWGEGLPHSSRETRQVENKNN
jgi:hypothetical protein